MTAIWTPDHDPRLMGTLDGMRHLTDSALSIRPRTLEELQALAGQLIGIGKPHFPEEEGGQVFTVHRLPEITAMHSFNPLVSRGFITVSGVSIIHSEWGIDPAQRPLYQHRQYEPQDIDHRRPIVSRWTQSEGRHMVKLARQRLAEGSEY